MRTSTAPNPSRRNFLRLAGGVVAVGAVWKLLPELRRGEPSEQDKVLAAIQASLKPEFLSHAGIGNTDLTDQIKRTPIDQLVRPATQVITPEGGPGLKGPSYSIPIELPPEAQALFPESGQWPATTELIVDTIFEKSGSDKITEFRASIYPYLPASADLSPANEITWRDMTLNAPSGSIWQEYDAGSNPAAGQFSEHGFFTQVRSFGVDTVFEVGPSGSIAATFFPTGKPPHFALPGGLT